MKEIFQDKLVEVEQYLGDLKQIIERLYQGMVKQETELKKAGYLGLIDFHQRRLEELKREKNKWEYRLKSLSPRFKDSNLDINKAKQFPIGLLLSTKKGRDGGSRCTYQCPFHEDKTPSFTWYKNSNSWYCFSCVSGGDVIELYQRIHGCDFKTAIHSLCT